MCATVWMPQGNPFTVEMDKRGLMARSKWPE